VRKFLRVIAHLLAILFTVGTLLFAFAAVAVAGLIGWALVLAAAGAAITLHFKSTSSGIARGAVAYLIASITCIMILGLARNLGALEIGLITTASLWVAALITKRHDRAKNRHEIAPAAEAAWAIRIAAILAFGWSMEQVRSYVYEQHHPQWMWIAALVPAGALLLVILNVAQRVQSGPSRRLGNTTGQST
jgi:hypothetical protein